MRLQLQCLLTISDTLLATSDSMLNIHANKEFLGSFWSSRAALYNGTIYFLTLEASRTATGLLNRSTGLLEAANAGIDLFHFDAEIRLQSDLPSTLVRLGP